VFPVRYELSFYILCRRSLVMDLEETEARNDCAGEGQQQSNRPADDDRSLKG
jgi:hypothetical protein